MTSSSQPFEMPNVSRKRSYGDIDSHRGEEDEDDVPQLMEPCSVPQGYNGESQISTQMFGEFVRGGSTERDLPDDAAVSGMDPVGEKVMNDGQRESGEKSRPMGEFATFWITSRDFYHVV